MAPAQVTGTHFLIKHTPGSLPCPPPAAPQETVPGPPGVLRAHRDLQSRTGRPRLLRDGLAVHRGATSPSCFRSLSRGSREMGAPPEGDPQRVTPTRWICCETRGLETLASSPKAPGSVLYEDRNPPRVWSGCSRPQPDPRSRAGCRWGCAAIYGGKKNHAQRVLTR